MLTQTAAGMDVFGPDAGVESHVVVARVQSHHDFFHGGVAGPFPYAV